MSASDEIVGLPGGAPLAALATLVRSNPQAVRDLAANWSEATVDCEYHTTVVQRAVTEVRQDWRGSSARAFVTFMGRFNAAGRAAQASLKNCSRTMYWIARTLEDAQTSVEHICDNLLSEVARIRAANPKAASPQLDAQLAAVVGEAVDAARTKVDQAQQILGQAHATLSRELAQLNVTFSALTPPATHAFLPVGGGPIGWRPVIRNGSPGTQAGGTALASGATPLSSGVAWTGGVAPPARVRAWIGQACAVLEAHGVPAAKLNPNDIWIIIKHESSGDPNAINLTDSNAAAGDPSKGLMQTTSATFDSYALPGYGSIYNPVDNIVAGVRYAIATYGSLGNVPGVVAVLDGQPYVGY